MIIIKNPTLDSVFISDLGIKIGTKDSVIAEEYGLNKGVISSSSNLRNLVANCVLIISDGISDLPVSEALNHIKIETEYEDKQGSFVLPVGGKIGQVLVKLSNKDYDAGWIDVTGVTPHEDIPISLNYYFQERHWERSQTYHFEGTKVVGTPKTFTIECSFHSRIPSPIGNLKLWNGTLPSNDSSSYGELRVWDQTHRRVVAISAPLMGSGKYTFSNILNLSENKCNWKLQGRVSRRHSELWIGTFTIKFK